MWAENKNVLNDVIIVILIAMVMTVQQPQQAVLHYNSLPVVAPAPTMYVQPPMAVLPRTNVSLDNADLISHNLKQSFPQHIAFQQQHQVK